MLADGTKKSYEGAGASLRGFLALKHQAQPESDRAQLSESGSVSLLSVLSARGRRERGGSTLKEEGEAALA